MDEGVDGLVELVAGVGGGDLGADAGLALGDDRVVAMEAQGAEVLQITMPLVSDFRTGGLLRVEEGKWQLLSVQEPPRGVDGKAGGRAG